VGLMPRKRKGIVQIRFEILEYLYYNSSPQQRTHIWRKATTLSYDDFQKHITYLQVKELVKEDEYGDSIITSKGREVYKKLRDVLPSIL
jgi:predicted transcriptional regulator